MKRSSEFLTLRKAQSRAAIESRLEAEKDRLARECERVVQRHPYLSLGAAGLTGWLTASSLVGARGPRGALVADIARGLQRLVLLRRMF